MDDGKISALTFDECAHKTEVVVRIFQLAGFNLSWSKSVLVPTQTLLFQGFIIDTKNMKYFCPEDKQSKYLSCLKELIQFHTDHGFVKAEHLASILGQLQSLNRSHGNITRVMLRGCAHELGKATLLYGWNTVVFLHNTIGELKFMLNNLSQFNSRHIAVTKKSSGEWGADRFSLIKIFSNMNFCPDVDCFATSESTICPKFFAKCPQVGDCSVNFFAQDLVPSSKYFVCPPVKYIARAFLRFVSYKNLSALFVVPLWKSSIFWPVIHDGQYFHPNIVNTTIFSCKPLVFNAAESRFSKEHLNVEFLAFLVKT